MKVIIDRFEGGFAVVELEDASFVNMSKKLLPPDAKEGDVVVILVDREETKKRSRKIGKLMVELFED